MTALAEAASEAKVLPPANQKHHQQYDETIASGLPQSSAHQSSCSVPEAVIGNGAIDCSTANNFVLPSPRVDLKDPQANSLFIMPKCVFPPSREFQLVEEFVAAAVSSTSVGTVDAQSRQGYRAILDAVRRRDDPPMLRKVLLALRTAENGSTLHRLATSPSTTHAQLIHFIFRLDPFELPPPLAKNDLDEKGTALAQPILDFSLADAHFHLIIALVSANSVFLTSAVSSLWKLIMSPIHGSTTVRTQRVHTALANIIRVCPKAKMELFPVMASNFPFRTRPAPNLVWYCRQCFAALDYLPSIHGQLLELIIERCLEIDVEIKINDGGEVSFDQDNDDDGLFEIELDAIEKPSPSKLQPEATVDDMADKLDSLMLLLFEHIQNRTKASNNTIRQFFDMISPAFDSSIIITHKSKYVQFIVFFLCGMDNAQNRCEKPVEAESRLDGGEELYREFATKLIEVILDPYRATVTRQSGTCYLASFVSRASFVCSETVCETISALLRCAEAYLASWNPLAARASDSRHNCEAHSLFYTICQAAFYVMCFRGGQAIRYYRDAVRSKQLAGENNPMEFSSYNEHIDIGCNRWTKLCCHELQPLRYCLESVRGEFLHVAEVYELVDRKALEQLNAELPPSRSFSERKHAPNRILTAATLEKQRLQGGIGGLGRGSNPLDSFFPFDPYLLRRSYSFVEPFYIEWNGPIEDVESDDISLSGDVAVDVTPDQVDESDAASLCEENTDDVSSTSETNASPSTEQPMSLASTSGFASFTEVPIVTNSPNANSKKEAQKLAWKASLKRARANSVENGSW